MGITKVLASKSSKRVIDYLENPKYDDRVRNVGFFSIGIGASSPYRDISSLLASRGKLNRTRRLEDKEAVNEIQHIITSFALDELDPDNEDDIKKAQQIMQELMVNDYKEYGAASLGYLQNDNGFLHFHRVYPTVTIDGKGLKGDVYNFYHCAYKLDNAMEKYGVNQSILTMKEKAEGYTKGEKLEGPRKNNRNEIKAYIAGVIDEGLKDVNINSEEKYVEYLESKDISLNKRKRVGDSRKAGYDIYDWTYEYHYVDKGPKLKDKSMKVRAKQITDENGENIYTPDPVSQRLKNNLLEFNKIAEENRRKREDEARRKAEEAKERKLKTYDDYTKDELLEMSDEEYESVKPGKHLTEYGLTKIERKYRNQIKNKDDNRAEGTKAAEVKPIEETKPKIEEDVKIEATEPEVVEDNKDKDGNGVDDYHEYVVNKRVSEIEELSKFDEDEIITEEDLIEEARKEKPKTTKVKADLNRKSPFKKTYTKSEFENFKRLGDELNAQLDDKDDDYGY